MINLPHNYYLQYRLQWIEILGTRYKPGGVVVLSVEDYNFGLISDVIVFDVDDYYNSMRSIKHQLFYFTPSCI